jgi:hypothetical protein
MNITQEQIIEYFTSLTPEAMRALERDCAAARERKAAVEREQRRAACPLQWRFTLSEAANNSFDRVRSGSGVLSLHLRAEVANKEAAQAAGYSESELRGGGMTYLYNTCNGKFIGSFSGGNVYIGTYQGKNSDAEATYTRLEDRIQSQPHKTSWDVTDIILEQPGFKPW